MRLEDFGLSLRACNALKHSGIYTMEDLSGYCAMSGRDAFMAIQKIRGCGVTLSLEILDKLECYLKQEGKKHGIPERAAVNMGKVIAIDFDGCLCENKFPDIGAPHWGVIRKALDERKHGARLILWTCRDGTFLDAAVNACKSWGLEFDAVNDSLGDWKVRFGSNPRKVGATEYWDDKAVKMDGTYLFVNNSDTKANAKMSRQRMTGLQESRKQEEKHES